MDAAAGFDVDFPGLADESEPDESDFDESESDFDESEPDFDGSEPDESDFDEAFLPASARLSVR